MDKIKHYVNHPLSKSIAVALIGVGLLMENHLMYSGIAFGMALREFLLALKK